MNELQQVLNEIKYFTKNIRYIRTIKIKDLNI